MEIEATKDHPEAGNIKVRLKGDDHDTWLAPKHFKPSMELEAALRYLLNFGP